MRRNGFTLIELLVVIVIIGILVAIALPNFIKIKDKAKEAELKQNLHSIQLAVERYAVDAEGNYPYFLYGGDALFNKGTTNHILNISCSGWTWGRVGHTFDMFIGGPGHWGYPDASANDLVQARTGGNSDLQGTFGDTLQYEGYLPVYPRNPFRISTSGQRWFSYDARQWNNPYYTCWGGFDGDKMFNTGWQSELNMLAMYSTLNFNDHRELLRNEFAGSFAYHARWSDGHTNYEHNGYQKQYNPQAHWLGQNHPSLQLLREALNPPVKITSLDVAGYDLQAVGSPRTKGNDLDNTVNNPAAPGIHWYRTGYLTLGQERNPHVGSLESYPNVPNYGERPYSDGVPDFMIIHLGSGMDKKPGQNAVDN